MGACGSGGTHPPGDGVRGGRTRTGRGVKVSPSAPAVGRRRPRTPAKLVAARSTLTGEHLAAYVGSRPEAVASR